MPSKRLSPDDPREWLNRARSNLSDLGVGSQAHIRASYKAPWYEITDSLPQFEEGPDTR